jgi:hypothetical protein
MARLWPNSDPLLVFPARLLAVLFQPASLLVQSLGSCTVQGCAHLVVIFSRRNPSGKDHSTMANADGLATLG